MKCQKLTQLQIKLLEMLKWFDSFCRENGLKYYAVGGTLLGAVRHNGFIPWDDDIDLAMPREDYDKLGQIMENMYAKKYVLETYMSQSEDYCYPYCKIYDTTTTLIEKYKKPLKRGIFLDIFPIDGAGNTKSESIKWCKSVNRDYNFYLSRMAAIRKDRSFLKNLAIIISSIVPQFFINNRKLRISLDKKCRRYDIKDSKYCGNLLGNWGTREIVPTYVIGQPKDYDFEDMKIMGIENYDEYLTYIYGDWRKLPPKDKQVSHHEFLYIDLTKPYK